MMTSAMAEDLRHRLHQEQVKLAALERDIATCGGRRDDDAEAARDVRLALIALVRAQKAFTPRTPATRTQLNAGAGI